MKTKNNKNRGFTLIELLLVISIISLLSSVILASLTKARINARDAIRISDIRQMRIALELYRNANGDYPNSNLMTHCYGAWLFSNPAETCASNTWSGLQTALAPYMKKVPLDPTNNSLTPSSFNDDNYGYAYSYDPATYVLKKYDLIAQLENKSSSLRCGVKQWVLNANGSSWCNGSPNNYSNYIYSGEY